MIPAPLSTAQLRLQEAVTDHITRWVETTPTVSRVYAGTVVSVTAGGAADGNSLVQVSVQGGTVPAAYLAAYTPTVGHVVAVARTGSQLLILGRILGTPP